MKFIKELVDIDIYEEETATFECVINKPNKKSTWKKGNKEFKPTDRISIEIDGKNHRLTLEKCELDDSGIVRCFIEDLKTKGKLNVTGKFVKFCLKPFIFPPLIYINKYFFLKSHLFAKYSCYVVFFLLKY